MKDGAMNLTFGDLILIEIALVTYIKQLDLSMQSGQYISELLGKLEYQLTLLKQEFGQPTVPLQDNAALPPLKPN